MLSADLQAELGELRLQLGLSAQPGSCLALVGPSGSGKTSALRAIAGLLPPSDGVIRCGGITWLDTSSGIEVPPENRRCGFVFQDYALFDHMTVSKNVAYALRGLPRAERRGRAAEMLERFGIAELSERRTARLSGGERQRVALARALAPRPRALLLDEPLSALDARTRRHASREIAAVLAETAIPSVIVTHDFDEAATLADEVAVMDAGSVVQRDRPEALAAAPGSAFVADLVGSVVLAGTAHPRPGGTTEVALERSGTIFSTDSGITGPAAASVHPWEITLEPAGPAHPSSARNRLTGRITSVVGVGSRVRVAVDVGQPLVAEVTEAAVEHLGLRPGAPVTASWKASATRVVER